MVAKTYLAERLRDARKRADIDVNSAGEMLGRSGKTISAWEAGTNEPSPEMMIDICKCYNVPISFFFPPEVQNGNALTAEERELLEAFRNMAPRFRELLLENARVYRDGGRAKNNQVSEGIA